MTTAIVIPARYGSSRLPGKPMLEIAGVSMLERVWRVAKSTSGVSRIVVATEDERVLNFARAFGAEAVLTPESCKNGSERVHATIDAAELTESAIINFQGDAVLTPPWVLQAMIDEFRSNDNFDIVTPAVELSDLMLEELRQHKVNNPSSGTTVVFDRNRNALYFSKNIIPHFRKHGHTSIFRHIGLYGYRREALAQYVDLEPTPLELTEGLEQLRALESGMTVRVVIVDYQNRTHGSVDTEDDISFVERIIENEGELVRSNGDS